jgi:DNA polymerase III delta prime subunit
VPGTGNQVPGTERTDAARPEGAIEIDGTGKKGPLFRHIGDHPDLYWIDRGIDGTRVRISQIRALQGAMRLSPNEGGWRAAVIADAEWLNDAAQNALLRLLEEPPDRTCLVLVTASPAGLLATIRSRCQRVSWRSSARPALRSADSPEEIQQLAARLDRIGECRVGDLLDWAEEYRGPRAIAAQKVQTLIASSAEWIREYVTSSVVPEAGEVPNVRADLDAFATLSGCRKDLAQRNANPQMVAERGLFAVREALSK